MKYDIETLKSNIPTVSRSYGTFDIVGQTFGRYWDYKKETAMIEHATEKLEYQTEIILKQIDSELIKSLDNNDKNFKIELKRLKVIVKNMKNNRKSEKAIMKHIENLTKQLSNPNIPIEVKQSIPSLIASAHQSLTVILSNNNASIDAMSNLKSNQNQIEG